MAAANVLGHTVVYHWPSMTWTTPDGAPLDSIRTCAHCGREQVLLSVPDDEGNLHTAPVDACIAPLVRALNAAGVSTRFSCCGHGHEPGRIMLTDGSELAV